MRKTDPNRREKKNANKRISKDVTFRPRGFPSARQVPAKQGEKCNNTADSIPQLFKTFDAHISNKRFLIFPVTSARVFQGGNEISYNSTLEAVG